MRAAKRLARAGQQRKPAHSASLAVAPALNGDVSRNRSADDSAPDSRRMAPRGEHQPRRLDHRARPPPAQIALHRRCRSPAATARCPSTRCNSRIQHIEQRRVSLQLLLNETEDKPASGSPIASATACARNVSGSHRWPGRFRR